MDIFAFLRSNTNNIGPLPPCRCFDKLFGVNSWPVSFQSKLDQQLRGVLQHLQNISHGFKARLAANLRLDPLIVARQRVRGFGYNSKECLEELAGFGFMELVVTSYPECLVEDRAMRARQVWQSLWLLNMKRKAWWTKLKNKKRCGIQLGDVYACVVSKRVQYICENASLERLLRVEMKSAVVRTL